MSARCGHEFLGLSQSEYSVSSEARGACDPIGAGLSCLIVIAWTLGWSRLFRVAFVLLVALVAAGCDPIVNVQGSFFPAWVVCMIVSVVLTLALRQVFAASRIEPHLGPLLLVYPSLWVVVTLLTWLVFYRT